MPDYCLIEVAEHALALMLSLARKVAFYHWQTKGGKYDLAAGPALARIEGQTLGIVGLGNIGRVLARKAQGLGLKIVATSRSARDVPPGVKLVSLDDLLATSDYVSLHMPVVPETRHLINERALGRMKPTAYLINTARGGLIDNEALAAGVGRRTVGGRWTRRARSRAAGPGHRAVERSAGDCHTARRVRFARVAGEPRSRTSRQVAMYLSGERPENVVNPEVL